MTLSIEKLWNIGSWAHMAAFAQAIAVGVSILAAAHYLHGIGAPLHVARAILLGV